MFVGLAGIPFGHRSIPRHHLLADLGVVVAVLSSQGFVMRKHSIYARFFPPPFDVVFFQERLISSERNNILMRHRYQLRIALFPFLPDDRSDFVGRTKHLVHQRLQIT